jgi:hypothetical protein
MPQQKGHQLVLHGSMVLLRTCVPLNLPIHRILIKYSPRDFQSKTDSFSSKNSKSLKEDGQENQHFNTG